MPWAGDTRENCCGVIGKRRMNKDAEQLKGLAEKISTMEFDEIRMKTAAGRERYMAALERILCVIAYLREDF